jgi:hypothetical protein
MVTLAVLLLSAAVVIGSGANFTSQSANPGNMFTAGNLKHFNSLDTFAILTMDKMKPTDSITGSVTLTNDGDVPGDFTLTKTVTANTLGLTGGDFRTKLDLVISEGVTPVWSGKIGGALSGLSLGTWAVGESHTYDFLVTFPDGGAGGADNPYKSASVTVRFQWDAT